MNRLILLLSLVISQVAAFVPRNPTRGPPSSELYELILGEDLIMEDIDQGLGGVRLAEENVIKIMGEVRHKPGSAESRAMDLVRYTQVTTVEESKVKDVLGKFGGKIIATGEGTELYKDPGESLETLVTLGPMAAIKEAFNSAAAAIEEKSLVINFLGGDDLVLGEVLDATNELVVMMDIATGAKVSFNSVCHSSIPSGTCTVCVVSVGENEAEVSGLDESIAAGEVYMRDGVWYTVDKANINAALA
jgi:hypothetical protein